MLNETKKQFTPDATAASEVGVTPTGRSVHILAFSTANYDAMIKFFRDFGFTVAEDPHDQLTPFFEHGRASRVSRDGLEFQLEESESADAKACFNLWLPDSTDEDVARVKALGYACDSQASIYGEFHSFRSPDGGIIVL
jgi:hypothetical protein